MASRKNPKVFIHSERDSRHGETVARSVSGSLRGAGVDVFFDDDSIRAGDVWVDAIEQSIRESDLMVVVISRSSEQSKWFQNEVHLARSHQVPLLPVLAEDIPVPEWIRDLQVVYARTEEEIVRVVQIVMVKLGIEGEWQQAGDVPGASTGASSHSDPYDTEGDENVSANHTHRITRVVTVPDLKWIEIPEGEFLYGENNESLFLERFSISKYPITNSQYQTFIDDHGYEASEWWKDLETTQYEESNWPQPNRPKTNVNWCEAIAFTRWLSAQLGYEITLPTEQQWEKAARGAKGNEYPWGDFKPGYANTGDNSEGGQPLKQTTAVGVYPHGNSDSGIADLSGNVWEWCTNQRDNPKDTQIDTSSGARVLRGGSWVDFPGNARATRRYGDYPGNRYSGSGFRVVCVLPFTDH